MTDQVAKFIGRLTPKQRLWVINIIRKIRDNKFTGLDIKPLSEHKGWYRCRTGKIRIVFVKTSAGTNIIYAVAFRSQIYKKT